MTKPNLEVELVGEPGRKRRREDEGRKGACGRAASPLEVANVDNGDISR